VTFTEICPVPETIVENISGNDGKEEENKKDE
jgi:hypothetical protein